MAGKDDLKESIPISALRDPINPETAKKKNLLWVLTIATLVLINFGSSTDSKSISILGITLPVPTSIAIGLLSLVLIYVLLSFLVDVNENIQRWNQENMLVQLTGWLVIAKSIEELLEGIDKELKAKKHLDDREKRYVNLCDDSFIISFEEKLRACESGHNHWVQISRFRLWVLDLGLPYLVCLWTICSANSFVIDLICILFKAG